MGACAKNPERILRWSALLAAAAVERSEELSTSSSEGDIEFWSALLSGCAEEHSTVVGSRLEGSAGEHSGLIGFQT